jgi:hypothetical protein
MTAGEDMQQFNQPTNRSWSVSHESKVRVDQSWAGLLSATPQQQIMNKDDFMWVVVIMI